ncbi:N-(5'-phosphoribosyl)anthranilate isomerase [Gammaproteobacteria bacterium]|jgi:phosphoribosylanthranilate isomerase|nr:N-(5'-phosphoribosyl)anthranilate isomerase [Gammaproteobacteria bacterium]
MTTFVKICGLRDTADVAAAVEAGANAVGFVFAESIRRVTPRQAQMAIRDVPGDVHRVAVMRHPTSEECRAVLEEFEADIVQTDVQDFSGLELPGHVARWPVLREGSADPGAALPEVFVYEGTNSGAGQPVDWEQASGFALRGRMILAGGLRPDNVPAAVRAVRPWGVDVSSGVERQPGRKDHDLIRQFVSAVRAVEREL